MNDQATIQKETAEPKGVAALPAIRNLAKSYDLSAEHFVFTFRSIAMPKDHTDAEFVSCCLVAREHGLNPLTKEIYFMKTKSGAIQPIVSVDGWVRKCNEHPQFDGMEFSDELNGDDLSAVTCTIFRKDRGHPTRVTEHLDECKANGGPAWKSSPRRMLRHRALTQAARYAFGFAGVMDRDEFDQWQAMRDITPKAEPLSIPDIPDAPTAAEASQAPEIDGDTIADPDKFLANLADEIELCTSAEELAEIKEGNAGVIERLPKAQKAKAEKMLAEAAE